MAVKIASKGILQWQISSLSTSLPLVVSLRRTLMIHVRSLKESLQIGDLSYLTCLILAFCAADAEEKTSKGKLFKVNSGKSSECQTFKHSLSQGRTASLDRDLHLMMLNANKLKKEQAFRNLEDVQHMKIQKWICDHVRQVSKSGSDNNLRSLERNAARSLSRNSTSRVKLDEQTRPVREELRKKLKAN